MKKILARLSAGKGTKKGKDKIFVMIAALVTAGLAYHLIWYIWIMIENKSYMCPWCYALIAGNIIALVATLWLLQNYRKRRRLEKEQEQKPELPTKGS